MSPSVGRSVCHFPCSYWSTCFPMSPSVCLSNTFLRMGAGFQKPAKMGSVCIQKEPKKMHRERFYFDKIYKTRSGWTPLDKHARGQKFVNSPFKSLKCCEIYYSKPGFFPRKSVGNSYLKGHIVTQNNLINRSFFKQASRFIHSIFIHGILLDLFSKLNVTNKA